MTALTSPEPVRLYMVGPSNVSANVCAVSDWWRVVLGLGTENQSLTHSLGGTLHSYCTNTSRVFVWVGLDVRSRVDLAMPGIKMARWTHTQVNAVYVRVLVHVGVCVEPLEPPAES